MDDKTFFIWRRFMVPGLIAFPHALGRVVQYFLWGPDWLRWHLTDFGYPMAIGAYFFIITGRRIFGLIGLVVGFVVGLIWEVLQFMHGEGDPVDVFCLVLGLALGYFIYQKLSLFEL